jgi:hypothetical protein
VLRRWSDAPIPLECRSKVSGLVKRSLAAASEPLLSSLDCFWAPTIEWERLESPMLGWCSAALPKLLVLTRSFLLRYCDSLRTYQKLFEALFVPSDWRATACPACGPCWLLNTGVKADYDPLELSR